ncbi:hypothetical protein JCM5350_001819 [Sporobolomyces pararoseus]
MEGKVQLAGNASSRGAAHPKNEYCPRQHTHQVLLLLGRKWSQKELAFIYDDWKIYELFTAGDVEGGPKEAVNEARRSEFARRQGSSHARSLSKLSASLTTRQRVVYDRSSLLA